MTAVLQVQRTTVQFRQNAEWLPKGILGAGVWGAKCWLVNGFVCVRKILDRLSDQSLDYLDIFAIGRKLRE